LLFKPCIRAPAPADIRIRIPAIVIRITTPGPCIRRITPIPTGQQSHNLSANPTAPKSGAA